MVGDAGSGKSDQQLPRGSAAYPPDLLARVARLHFEFGLTHQETAKSLGLSRVKVTRMVKQARESGLVTMVVASNVGLTRSSNRTWWGVSAWPRPSLCRLRTSATGACARCWRRASSGTCPAYCART